MQVALWLCNYYNSQHDIVKDKFQTFCICTEDTKVSDLIGYQTPSQNDKSNQLIKWQDGFLTTAIKNGICSILESIDEANCGTV